MDPSISSMPQTLNSPRSPLTCLRHRAQQASDLSPGSQPEVNSVAGTMASADFCPIVPALTDKIASSTQLESPIKLREGLKSQAIAQAAVRSLSSGRIEAIDYSL